MATSNVRLHRAEQADYGCVERLFAALHAHNANLDPAFALAPGWRDVLRAHFTRTCDEDGALWMLARDAEAPVGLLVLEAHTDSPLFAQRHWAELVALYVAPTCRGGELAAQLLRVGQQWARRNGFDRVQLYVTATNHRARAFYARQGFRPVQEIWRLPVVPDPAAAPPADPSCGVDGAHGGDHLEMGHHHLAMELDAAEGVPMIDLFAARPANDPQRVAAIKQWVAEVFMLNDETTVMVHELRCSEPGCPPLETVIALLQAHQPTRQYKLHKAVADLTRDDINTLIAHQSQGEAL